MNINFEFLIIAFIVSPIVDWILQWEWQAMNKSRWGKGDNKKLSLSALFTHSWVYASVVTLVCLLLGVLGNNKSLMVLLVLFISHFIIDNRYIVKLVLRFKGISKYDVENNKNLGFLHIGIDRRLHELVILLLSLFI